MYKLKVGDLAVYPAHGVGRIEAMEQRTISGQLYDFFVMRILDNNMKIMIPSQNIAEIGLRPLIQKNEIKNVYHILKTTPKPTETVNWNRRHRDYMDKIKTGSIFDVAAVLGELLAMRSDKELSFGERKLLDTVRTLFVKEIALSSSRQEDDVDSEITTFFPPPKAAT
ncbi:MAG: CarD family transcriptional regulator [Candidatus Adiutrix sp.]